MSLVENLKKTCKSKGITMHELERRAGIAPNSIYKWDKNSPSVNKVNAAAAVLDVKIDDLVNGKEGNG